MADADPPRAISTPALDLASVGGLSLVVLLPLLVVRDETGWTSAGGLVFALNLCLNWPHFMASYRLVYRSRATVVRYRAATIYVPLALLAWSVFALGKAEEDGLYVHLLVVTSGLYLGIHYTGQTWGMVAAFSALEGMRFLDDERRMVRSGLYALAFWQASRFLTHHAQLPDAWAARLAPLVEASTALVVFLFFVSVFGLVRFSRRQGRPPPLRALVAWVSLYVWYAVFAFHPLGAFWVQIAHSLQYLIFPARLELNRAAQRGPPGVDRPRLRVFSWWVFLVVAGFFVFRGLTDVLRLSLSSLGLLTPGQEGEIMRLMPIVVTAFVNIHHFFTDGVIWKLRDADVRRDLFFHLGPGSRAG